MIVLIKNVIGLDDTHRAAARTLVLRGWKRTLNIFYAEHVMFSPPTHPVFFALGYLCNDVVFGALLGWARRNLRFAHKLARFIRYHLALG